MQSGGDVESVIKLIEETELKPTFVNPASKFVVITYWWGKDNLNKNLQRPCPEDITEPIKEEIEEMIVEDDRESETPVGLANLYDEIAPLNAKRRDKTITEEETRIRSGLVRQIVDLLRPKFAEQKYKDILNQKYNQAVASLKAEGKFVEPRTFSQMIAHWEETMAKANCNYMATNIEFPRGDYQNAINGKPLFIRRALDMLKEIGKGDMGVLYIDGDMDIHKYPGVFDIPNVDFMARGWNVDPRDNKRYKETLCFDPYVFETSGGTMYFGNTQTARVLLDAWASVSADPVQRGKADDRILSMVFTQKKFALEGTVIQLPIEYLWLTDKYAGRFVPPTPEEGAPVVPPGPMDAHPKEAIIEHPACLTGEERAADQGAAENRFPVGYESIEEAQRCATRGGVFYEYVAFPTPESMEGFKKYLTYMKEATQPATGEKLFEIVSRADRYGRYNTLADRNEAAAKRLAASPTFPTDMEVTLPGETKIPEILAHLMKGHSVFIKGRPEKMSLLDEAEFVGTNLGVEEDPFHNQLRLDTGARMFIKPTNPIVLHLLKMCRTLGDINTHLEESYIFLSRIRWFLSSQGEEAVKKRKQAITAERNPFAEDLPDIAGLVARKNEPPPPPPAPRRRRTGGRTKSGKKSTLRQKRI